MPPKTERQVIHTVCMIMVMITTAMSMKAAASSSRLTLSPLPSPASLHLHPIKQQADNYHVQPTIEEDDNNLFNSLTEQHREEGTIEEEDYGIWNPTPYLGGDNSAPIPHGKVS